MRVLLVGGRFPQLSQTFIVAHFTGLLARGVDVHFWGSAGDDDAWDAFPGLDRQAAGRLHVHAPSERPWLTARDVLKAGVNARVVAAALGQRPPEATRRVLAGSRLAALRPDVIHFEFGLSARGATWMRAVAGCPIVVSFRGYDLNYTGLDEPGYWDDVWRHADAVHCLGEDLWLRALRRGCPPGMPHRLIAPAVDTARFSPAPRADDGGPLRVLTVARVVWKKGYEYGLLAIRGLVDAGVDVEYRIVGAGPYEDAVRACVNDLGLAEHVRLLGPVPPAGVLREMQAADVLLHPAVSEGFGNAVMEAQAVGTPVVCTDADGLRENVVDGVTGFVVPRREPSALAAALTRLRDRELRDRMGAAARAHVRERFDPERQMDAFVALYEDVLTAAGRTPAARAPAG